MVVKMKRSKKVLVNINGLYIMEDLGAELIIQIQSLHYPNTSANNTEVLFDQISKIGLDAGDCTECGCWVFPQGIVGLI